jgi:hypothetical protein
MQNLGSVKQPRVMATAVALVKFAESGAAKGNRP